MPVGLERTLPRTGVPFARELARFGDAPALVAGELTLSYAQLAERVDAVAARLGDQRRLVLVAAANAIEPLVAYLGALAGGHPVLLAPADRPDVVDGLVAAYDPDVVLGCGARELAERCKGSAHALHDELALLLSTSGSTGSPKLVRLSRDNVQSNAEAIAKYLGIGPGERAVTTLPPHYCYGLSVINSHLTCGATVVLSDLSVVDRCFWELVRRERVTSFAGVPYTFELLERVGFADMELPHLRYVTQAGGKLAPERVARWAQVGRARGWELVVMYGQTEATARMAYLPPALASVRPQAIGVPIPGGSFALAPVPECDEPGVGELVYRGPNVMLGYAEGPADLARGRDIEELRTGDLARRGDDGLWEIVGRRARFAKVVGLRIDLDRAEALLGACCAGRDEQLVVATDAGDGRDAAALRRQAAQALGVPAGAVAVVRLAELPRLPSSKVDYRALLALAPPPALAAADPGRRPCAADGHAADGDGAGAAAAAVTAARLRAALADVLDLDAARVRDSDTFVSLGGDSLSYVQASLRLEAVLGSLPVGWHVTPLGELAAAARTSAAPGRAASGARLRRLAGALAPRRLETSVLLRAAAIVLIVGTHAKLFGVLGGAHLLMAVAGFNFARFQLGPGTRAARLRRQAASVARIALPSVAWIAAAALLLAPEYGVANVLLANALVGAERWTPQWQFWFVEVLLYILVALALVLAIPGVDRAERRWPLAFAGGVLAVGLLGRFGLVDVGVPNTKPVLWLFALGWLAARCRTPWQRAAVSAAALATVPGFFGDTQREALIAVGILVLLWLPSVPAPATLCRVAATLAAASLYIYLTHWQVFRPLADVPAVAVGASLAVGIAYWQLVTRVGRAWTAWRRRAAASPAPSTATAAAAAPASFAPPAPAPSVAAPSVAAPSVAAPSAPAAPGSPTQHTPAPAAAPTPS